MRIYQLLEDFVKPDGVTNTTGIAIVYHRTKSVDNVNQIKKDGFRPGNGKTYGKGIYTCYDLRSQMDEYNKQLYGNFIVKSKVNIEGFLNFDSPKINEQLSKIGIKTTVEHNEFSSVNAYNIYRKYQKLPELVPGIIFTGESDGKVLVVYRTNLIIPISYSKNDGKKWIDIKNRELIRTIQSSRDTLPYSNKEEYKNYKNSRRESQRFSNNKELIDKLINKTYSPDGKLIYGELKDRSFVTKIDFYINGRIRKEEHTSRDGFHNLNGPAVLEWYETGIPKLVSYYNHSRFHREDGPAKQEWYENGVKKSIVYYKNGRFYREDGPAIQEWFENGNKNHEGYLIDGKYHNTNGPSSQQWDEKGQRIITYYHNDGSKNRIDGPAIISYSNGKIKTVLYFINDKKISEKSYMKKYYENVVKSLESSEDEDYVTFMKNRLKDYS